MRRRLASLCLSSALLFGLLGHASRAQPLKVGATPTGLPFTFLDTKTNTIQGVMVDLVNAVGKEAGFTVAVEPLQFSTLIPALTASKIDIISAAMFITPQRKEVVAFSAPVYSYGEGLIVPKGDTKDYTSFADLKGEIVGAQVGTAFVEPLKKTGLFSRGEDLRHDPRHHPGREFRAAEGRLRRRADPRLLRQAGRVPRRALGRDLQADGRRLGRASASARPTRSCWPRSTRR